jgi:hypothetical protein
MIAVIEPSSMRPQRTFTNILPPTLNRRPSDFLFGVGRRNVPCSRRPLQDGRRKVRVAVRRGAPRLWQRLHPAVQIQARGRNPSFGTHLARRPSQTVTSLALLHIQPDVIHRFQGGASFGLVSQLAVEFSFSTPSAPPFDLYIQTTRHNRGFSTLSHFCGTALTEKGTLFSLGRQW